MFNGHASLRGGKKNRWEHMGVSYNEGTQKWMVHFMENLFGKNWVHGYGNVQESRATKCVLLGLV